MRQLILPFLIALALGAASLRAPRAQAPEPDAGTRAAIEDALDEAVLRSLDHGLAFVVFEAGIDRLRISADGNWALLWIAALDRDTGEPAAIEPWLAVGLRLDERWVVYLPGDEAFAAAYLSVPEEILPQDEREFWGDSLTQNCNTSGIGPFTGYKLPWPGGQSLHLTQSIYHTLGWGSGNNPTFSMIHAFDFSTAPSNLFNVWAARPGTVRYFRDIQPNNDPTTPGNYIVLEDTGTSPTSYQLYLHLAEGSIPAALKTVGTPVQQGAFIGVADDTGASSNHHLHFQVHTEVSWWGCSVDVRFSDVAINGGRPRLPIEAQNHPEYGSQGQTTYVSGNTAPPAEFNKPGGGILNRTAGQAITSPTVSLQGYAFDTQSGVASAQFAVHFGSGWVPVGQVFTFTPAAKGTVNFSGSPDLCAAGVPDGPVTLGVKATDKDGNVLLGGIAVPAVLNANCAPPPPACQPSANQAALFSLPDYRGTCVLLGTGTHVQSLPAASVLLGANVDLSLYISGTLKGRSQTYRASDANLADNWSGAETFAAAVVRLKTSAPLVPLPSWPSSGETLPLQTSLSLYWHDGGGSAEFQARLNGPGAQTITSSWGPLSHWDPGTLAPGAYTWEVRARNSAGTTTWGPSGSFSIAATPPVASSQVITAPLTENFDGAGAAAWTATGLWNLLEDASVSFNGARAMWYGGPSGNFAQATYDTGTPNTGSLTSPPVHIPGPGYYLRFYSRYESEGDGFNWDRRRVLISAADGPFLPVYTLFWDTMNSWVRSPFLDLSAYAGQTIRIRFVFETFDARKNGFDGWLIDELTIKTTPPPACTASNEPDGTPAQAKPIAYGAQASAEICPAGDVDYFTFTGAAGDRIIADIDAAVSGSPLDAALFLFDQDGFSRLAMNDDEVPGILLDPFLAYTLPRSGAYYLMVRKANHPTVATDAHTYTLKLSRDQVDPVISSFTASVPLTSLNAVPAQVTLSAAASDAGSGLAYVEFFYHSHNWGGEDWVSLGRDTNPADGWSAVWNTQSQAPRPGMALIAVAVDRAGNPTVAGMWNLFPLPPAVYIPVAVRPIP